MSADSVKRKIKYLITFCKSNYTGKIGFERSLQIARLFACCISAICGHNKYFRLQCINTLYITLQYFMEFLNYILIFSMFLGRLRWLSINLITQFVQLSNPTFPRADYPQVKLYYIVDYQRSNHFSLANWKAGNQQNENVLLSSEYKCFCFHFAI